MYSSKLLAQNAKLEKYTCIGNFTQANATSVLQKKLPPDSLKSTFSVNLYKINYKTTAPDGSTTSASGLVAMPISPLNKIGIVSYYHGTRITRTDIPSTFGENFHVHAAIFANSGGYMLVLPDYLGLGDSQLLHPYMHAESLANSSIDMILAAKELAAILQYPINDELYLAGYSEGGLTSIVTYEEILKNHKEIHVTAVAPGSGPYDWHETIQFMIKNPNPRVTLFFAYLFYAMQTYHSPWEGLDAIFKKPYATLIPDLLDGNHPIEEAFREFISLKPHEIMQDDFYDSIINGTNPATALLIKNFNHYNFKSTSPLMLIGTKGDLDIPFHCTEIAYQYLKKQSSNVYIRSVSYVLDHMQAMPYIMKEQLEFFNQYHH